MGTVAVVALAAACGDGTETSSGGVAGQDTAGTMSSDAGATAKAGAQSGGGPSSQAGMEAGGSATAGMTATGGMNTAGSTSGSSTGGSTAGTSSGATAGTSSGSGGLVNQAGEGGVGGDSSVDAGAGQGGMGGDASAQAGAAGETGQGGNGEVGCGVEALTWAPRASNVMFLMDRSGTMFDLQAQPWTSVRDAVLPVIDAYDGLENIGFLAMTGELASCPLFDEVAPGPANYTPIAAKYNALAKPTKGESPFMLALSRAQQLLAAAPAGDPFVIMVIDGEPDFCNDGDDLCPVDSVVARIQLLKAAGITTLVAGLPIYQGADAAVYAAALQSYANAGAGLPVASVGGTPADIYFRCQGDSATPPSWHSEFVASGKPAQQALGTYSASPGSAAYTSLNPANAASLSTAFGQLFARTQSCSFEAKNGKVALASAASGVVKLGAVTLPYDANDGWHMKSESVVELVGSACDTLRATPAATVSIDFPCDALTN